MQRPASTSEIVALASGLMPLPQELLQSEKKNPLEGERAVSIVLCYLVQHYHVLAFFCSLQPDSEFCCITISKMWQYSFTITSNLPNPFNELF